MEGELRLDLSTYRAMVHAVLGPKVWLQRGFGVLVLAWAVVAGMFGVGPIWVGLYALIGLGGVGVSEWTTRLGWRRLRGLTDQPWRYRIADGGIGIHTPATDTQFGWELITRATRAPQAWTLRTTTRQRLAIPRAAFSAADAARIDDRFASI